MAKADDEVGRTLAGQVERQDRQDGAGAEPFEEGGARQRPNQASGRAIAGRRRSPVDTYLRVTRSASSR